LLSQGSLFDRLDRVALTRASDEDIALQTVKLTIELGADVNAMNERGNTALHGAAVHGYVAVVQFLAQHGAGLDVKNRKGETPLKVSAGSEMTALLRTLGAKE
jgi:ankyrin repeat protein